MEQRTRYIEGDEVLFALIAGALVFLTKMSVLKVPYFWDELLVYMNPIRVVYERGPGNMVIDGSLFNPSNFFFHPPGLPLLFYPFLKVFGHSIFLMRFMALLSVWGSMLFTYKIGKLVHSKVLGLCAGLSLFALPLVFTQSTMILGDTFFMLFTVLYFFWLLRGGRFWPLLITGLIMGFVRETSLAFVPVAMLYFIKRRDFSIKAWAVALSPALGVMGFFFMGGLGHQAFVEGHIGLHNIPQNFISSFRFAVFEDYKEILLYPGIAVALLILFIPKLREKQSGISYEHLALLLLPVILFVSFFSMHSAILSRYFNPVLPFFTLLCFYPLVRFSRMMALLFLLIVSLRLPSYAFSSNTFHLGTGHETRMEYQEVLKVQTEAAHFLEKEFPLKRIWTTWPYDVMLSDSFFGYVVHSLKVVSAEEANKGNFDLYVWSSNMRVEFPSLLERDAWIKKQGLTLVRSFSHKNKWVEIYSK